jgi:hypothetical protein
LLVNLLSILFFKEEFSFDAWLKGVFRISWFKTSVFDCATVLKVLFKPALEVTPIEEFLVGDKLTAII